MENDVEVYSPLLKPLVEKENVEFIPKSGILWRDLSEMLYTSLTNQTTVDRNLEPKRNDTLLVTINLSYYPPKSFQQFECVSQLVLYQLMSSVRTASLFQQYGLVRMLAWIKDDGKRKLLPRTVFRRKRSTFESELACEWIHEVAGKDSEIQPRTELRDEWINMESGYRVLERMKDAGLSMPFGRETFNFKNLSADQSLANEQLAGMRPPLLNRPFRAELEALEAEHILAASKKLAPRLKSLRFRDKYDMEDSADYLSLLQERDAVTRLLQTSPADFPAADAAFSAKVDGMKKNQRNEFIVVRDNYHVWRQDPPAMMWDRRPFEPLAVQPEEFFPNIPCALLDFQPKATHPYVRQHGASSIYGDMSDVMLRFWFTHSLLPVSKAMDGLWPGFGDLAAQVQSLRDVAQGGTPLTENGELAARSINERQWTDILEKFVDWPFKPTYAQLVGRLLEDHDVEDDDELKASAMGAGQ